MTGLATIVKKYINLPFSDIGCLELAVAVLNDLGKTMPAEIDGIGLGNYRQLVMKNIRHAHMVMLRAFRKIGQPSNAKYPKIADLIVVLQKKTHGMFPAVYVGGGMAIASFRRKGVCVFKLDAYNMAVMARTVN